MSKSKDSLIYSIIDTIWCAFCLLYLVIGIVGTMLYLIGLVIVLTIIFNSGISYYVQSN
jgi:hypothetical protein